jgi:phosphate transport system substrate-binding protein
MFHKFGSENRFSLTAAFSVSAVVAAMVAAAPSAQAQACVPSANGTPSATCQQYFSAGATFPLLLNRQFFDYFGIAIQPGPAINPGQPGATGSQPTAPAGSPRNTNQQFNYCGTGSRNGRTIFTGVTATIATSASCSYTDITGILPFPTNTNIPSIAPLFAGNDFPLSSGDITNYTNTKLATRGNPIQVPTVIGGIVAAYNGGVTSNGLNLTTLDLCQIFAGAYTDYSQLSGTTGLSGGIRVLVADNSAITTVFTTYLASACPSVSGGSYYLTAGTNSFPRVAQTSNFTLTGGESLLVDTVATVSGGIGYMQASFASPYATFAPITTTTPAPVAASLQNPVSGSFIFPFPSAINRGIANITLTADTTYPCLLKVVGIPVVPTVGNAYPIISPTYTLAYTRYPSTAEANAVKSVYNFILGNRTVPFPGANDQIAQGLGFSVLNNGTLNPPTVTNQLRSSARACLNTITSP